MFLDGAMVVQNDFPQSATERCGTAKVHLKAGNHSLYIEGWSRNAQLSISATYQGADSQEMKMVIPGFRECKTAGASMGPFIICAYKADSSLDLNSVDDIYMYYNQVSKCMLLVLL